MPNILKRFKVSHPQIIPRFKAPRVECEVPKRRLAKGVFLGWHWRSDLSLLWLFSTWSARFVRSHGLSLPHWNTRPLSFFPSFFPSLSRCLRGGKRNGGWERLAEEPEVEQQQTRNDRAPNPSFRRTLATGFFLAVHYIQWAGHHHMHSLTYSLVSHELKRIVRNTDPRRADEKERCPRNSDCRSMNVSMILSRLISILDAILCEFLNPRLPQVLNSPSMQWTWRPKLRCF